MPTIETNTRKIVARLRVEGWIEAAAASTTSSSMPIGRMC